MKYSDKEVQEAIKSIQESMENRDYDGMDVEPYFK